MARWAATRPLPGQRVVAGFAVAVVAVPALTWLLVRLQTAVNLPSALLLFVVVVVFTAVIGGPWPALTAAVGSSLLVNYFLTPPVRTLTIQDPGNVVALAVFVVVAVIVSVLVISLAGRTEQVRAAAAAAARAEVAIAGDRTRTALLAAVSHDLRSPLASAKAAVDSLLSAEVQFGPEDTRELLSTAGESIDRLIALVEDLLQMSRLRAGALAVSMEAVDVQAAIDGALHSLQVAPEFADVQVATGARFAWADDGLLERVLGNLLANALRFSPAGQLPTVFAQPEGDRVEIRVQDSGPGVLPEMRASMFEPFQRLGDTDVATGVGLGLAIARGLTEAMGGTLTAGNAGGAAGRGLVMTVRLAAVPGTGT